MASRGLRLVAAELVFALRSLRSTIQGCTDLLDQIAALQVLKQLDEHSAVDSPTADDQGVNSG